MMSWSSEHEVASIGGQAASIGGHEVTAVVGQTRPEPGAVSPVFTGRLRWLAAAVLVAGPLLQFVAFLLENPLNDNAARVAYWAAHSTRVGLSMASGLLAVPFLIGGIVVLVALTRGRSPRLAFAAGALLTFAMVGLAAISGAELIAYGLMRSGDLAAATIALNGNDLGLPGPVLLVMFLGGAALGTATLAVAVWRSPLVPRVVAAFILAFAVLDFALGWGRVSHLVNLVGFAIVAVAVVVGYSRQTVELAETATREQQLAA
jgi:hypothetical protein